MSNLRASILFFLGYFIGVILSNAIVTQTIFEFTLTNTVQFSFGYFLGGIIIWILLRKKRRKRIEWKI